MGICILLPILEQFLGKVSILYSLKTPENQRFSGAFRGHAMEKLAKNGFMYYDHRQHLTDQIKSHMLVFFVRYF